MKQIEILIVENLLKSLQWKKKLIYNNENNKHNIYNKTI